MGNFANFGSDTATARTEAGPAAGSEPLHAGGPESRPLRRSSVPWLGRKFEGVDDPTLKVLGNRG